MNSLISHGFKLQSGVRKTRPPYSNMAGGGVVHWRILLLAKCPTTTITFHIIISAVYSILGQLGPRKRNNL